MHLTLRFRTVIMIVLVSLIYGQVSLWPIKHVYATLRPVMVSKTMRNITPSVLAAHGNNLITTVTSPSDTVQVNIVITNPEDDIPSIKIRDVYADVGKAWSPPPQPPEVPSYPTSVRIYSGGLSGGSCSGAALADVTNNSTNSYEKLLTIDQSVTGDLQGIKKGKQYCIQYFGRPNLNIFPTYKSRLAGYPMYVQDYNTSIETLYDVAYLYFIPSINNSQPQPSSSLYGSDVTNLDIGILIPGVTVTVTGGGPIQKNLTTPSTYVLQPNQSKLLQANNTDKSCKITTASQLKGRGGACIFATTATITDSNTNTQIGSAQAYFMALPSSTIIGNIYAGSALDASNVLLPGQHVGSSKGSRTVLSNENIAYSIDNNAISGWDATQIYRNVYENANIQRLRRNPDVVVDMSTCGSYTNIVCVAGVGNALPTVTLSSLNDFTFDMSSPDLSSPPTPLSARRNDFVVEVKGNLTIGNATSNPVRMTNMVGGTIIVDGVLTVQNVNIGDPNTTNQPLGLMALNSEGKTCPASSPPAGNCAITWQNTSPSSTSPNSNNSLYSVLFFTQSNFVASKPGVGTLMLKGSIVANDVDLTAVKPAGVAGQNSDAADLSGITVSFDSTMTSNPPPGFQLFSPTPVLKDLAP